MSQPHKVGRAIGRGLEVSRDLIRAVTDAYSPEQKQRFAQRITEGCQVRVIYGVLGKTFVAIELVETDGTVTEIARRELP